MASPSTPSYGSGYHGDKATATCFCSTVQMAFPPSGPNYIDAFICNCRDCRKITASMFASNFIVREAGVEYLRGKDKLSTYAQNHTIESGNTMTNHFCSVCGTLMFRVSSAGPDQLIMRVGTIDDFKLQEGEVKPRVEQFVRSRVAWLGGAEGVRQEQGNYYVSEAWAKDKKALGK